MLSFLHDAIVDLEGHLGRLEGRPWQTHIQIALMRRELDPPIPRLSVLYPGADLLLEFEISWVLIILNNIQELS